MTNEMNVQPDLLAIVGGDADLLTRPSNNGYRRLETSNPCAALWVRSNDRRIATHVDGDTITAFFGVTTTADPIGVIASKDKALAVEFQADPYLLVGHFAAISGASSSLSILTDQVGSVPVYVATCANNDGSRVVGTNLTDVAVLASRTDIDPVSAFEFVHAGLITAPHTIFSDVTRVGAGTILELGSETESFSRLETRYWVPDGGGGSADLDRTARNLNATMRANLDALSSQYHELAVLMSGGEDSRILAKSCRELRPTSNDLRGVIFIDAPNREWRLARAAARLIKIDLTARVRSSDHYTQAISPTVSLVGGGIDLTHAHSIGLIEPSEADLFLDGWSADSIFKAHTFKTSSMKIGRVQVSLEKPNVSPTDLGPEDWKQDETGRRVLARRELKRSQLLEFRKPAEATAWMSLWPISDHLDYGFFASNWRSRPSASPFMFANMVSLAAAVPVEQMVNRRLFHRAFSSSLGVAGWIPRTGGEIPRLGPRSNLVATNVMKVVFRLMAQVQRWRGNTVAQGPWQSFETRQAAVREAMESAPPSLLLEADRLARGPDATGSSQSDAITRWSTDQSNRVLQLASLLGQLPPSDD